ncbi:MAG: aminotransferase class I/II-fold pyridoxal phosphate-dependent enzyme, partial [Clostridia bacterium]|nr:aminotransferase class I/II-fold pyridoxal phosphate-dependent enzyme [Clostridia bacterium]
MLNERMLDLGKRSSVIREIFEYGNKRRAEIGAENVFDFSLGNPSVPCPPAFNETLKQLLDTVPAESLHGYTSGPGDLSVRKAVAADIAAKFGVEAPFDLVYMTCGAAASLCVTLNALAEEGDEVIAFAPFFPEYRVFTETTPAKLVVVPCKSSDLQLDFDTLEKAITPHTKALILNSPNNP